MEFNAKRPVLIRIQPEYVNQIKSGEKKFEYRTGKPFVDCNCFILHQTLENQGIAAVIEIDAPIPEIDNGTILYKYPILRVFDFGKNTIPIETAFDNTPIRRRFSPAYQSITYLRESNLKGWTPESEAAAAEAVRILLDAHEHTVKTIPHKKKTN